ncbi:7006_t:CDS:2, partial [Funneliformis geosporum]
KLPGLIKEDGNLDEAKLDEIKTQSDKAKELEKLGIKSVEEAKKLQENNKKMSELIKKHLGTQYYTAQIEVTPGELKDEEILEGELKINNFPNLKIINLEGKENKGSLDKINISECPNLEEIDLSSLTGRKGASALIKARLSKSSKPSHFSSIASSFIVPLLKVM